MGSVTVVLFVCHSSGSCTHTQLVTGALEKLWWGSVTVMLFVCYSSGSCSHTQLVTGALEKL